MYTVIVAAVGESVQLDVIMLTDVCCAETLTVYTHMMMMMMILTHTHKAYISAPRQGTCTSKVELNENAPTAPKYTNLSGTMGTTRAACVRFVSDKPLHPAMRRFRLIMNHG